MGDGYDSLSDDLEEELHSGGYEVYQSRISLPNNGGEYTGMLTEMGDKPHGLGILISDHMRYSGKFKLGRKHGLGKADFEFPLERYSNAQSCAAFWKNGMMNGPAVLKDFEENLYEGYMQLNVFHGKGRMRYSNGDVYEGNWEHGKHEGFGIMKYKMQKEMYIGMWKQGEYHGHGIYKFQDGAVYDGMWQNNKSHGIGLLLEPKKGGAQISVTNYAIDEKFGCGILLNRKYCLFGSFEKDENVQSGGMFEIKDIKSGDLKLTHDDEKNELWKVEDGTSFEGDKLDACLDLLLIAKQNEIASTLKSFKIRELDYQVFKQIRELFFADRDSVEAEVDAVGREFKVDDCEFSAEEDVRSEDEDDEGSDLEGFIVPSDEDDVVYDEEAVYGSDDAHNEAVHSEDELRSGSEKDITESHRNESASPTPIKKKRPKKLLKSRSIDLQDSEDEVDEQRMLEDLMKRELEADLETQSGTPIKSLKAESIPKHQNVLNESESDDDDSGIDEEDGFAELVNDHLKIQKAEEQKQQNDNSTPSKKKKKKKRKRSKRKDKDEKA